MAENAPVFKKSPPEKPYYRMAVEPGKTYAWCTCGLCQNRPFWDGPEVAPNCKPVLYTATEHRDVDFCGCLKTENPPYCDGAHKQLK